MPSLPGSTRAFGYTIVDNYIFVVGGYNGCLLNTVYYTTIDLTGQMANWSTSSNSLPIHHGSGSLAAAGRIFVFNRRLDFGYGYTEKVYKAS